MTAEARYAAVERTVNDRGIGEWMVVDQLVGEALLGPYGEDATRALADALNGRWVRVDDLPDALVQGALGLDHV